MRRCTKCKLEKNDYEFNKRPDRPSGYRSECKKCQYKRQSDNAKPADPFKRKARDTLRRAVRSGKLLKPKICQICWEEKIITAHHPDYNKPLEVEWLCYDCHKKKHIAA